MPPPDRPVPLLLGLVVATCLAAGCSAGPEPAEWDREIPDGVTVIESEPVDDSERSDDALMAPELVIGERGDDPNYILDWKVDVVADETGRIYALDALHGRIQVYAPDGEFVQTIGRPGEGPGELSQPEDLHLMDGTLRVHSWAHRRYRGFDRDGEFLGDIPGEEEYLQLGSVTGIDGGRIVGLEALPAPADRERGRDEGFASQHLALVAASVASASSTEIHRFRPHRRPLLWLGAGGGMMVQLPQVEPAYAVSRDGDVYAAQTDEYQLFAYALDGAMRWALRVAYERAPVTDADLEAAFDLHRELGREVPEDASARIWRPELRPALSHIEVDGQGRLWVFLEPRTREEERSGRIRVDVYDRDGERLAAGWAPNVSWTYARGDMMYSHNSDSPAGEQTITRYRIALD